jgi:hypothetical protein
MTTGHIEEFRFPTQTSFIHSQPGENGKQILFCVMMVPAKQLPDGLPAESNLRIPKATYAVYKRVRKSLVENPHFGVMHKGMACVAESISMDNGAVIVRFDKNKRDHQGIIDGGHTYSIIKEAQKDTNVQIHPDAYIQVRVTVNLSSEEAAATAIALNDNNPVTSESIADRMGDLDIIKRALSVVGPDGQTFKDKIRFRQNGKEPFEVKGLISLLAALVREDPLKASVQKAQCLKDFRDETPQDGNKEGRVGSDKYKQLMGLLPEILKFHDAIHLAAADIRLMKKSGYTPNDGETTNKMLFKRRVSKLHELPFAGQTSDVILKDVYFKGVWAAMSSLYRVQDTGQVAWRFGTLDDTIAVAKEILPKMIAFCRKYSIRPEMFIGKQKRYFFDALSDMVNTHLGNHHGLATKMDTKTTRIELETNDLIERGS